MHQNTTRLHRVMLPVLAIVAIGCGGDEPEPAPAPEPIEQPQAAEAPDEAPDAPIVDHLRLGYVLPETGPIAFLGLPMIAAVELAIADMNAAGGVLGNAVTLSPGDEAGDVELAREAAENLVSEGVNAVVGAGATAMTNAIVDTLTGSDVLQCSGMNSDSAFRDADHRGLYARTATNDALQGVFAIDVMRENGHPNPVIVAADDPFSVGLLDATVAHAQAAGVTVADAFTFDPDAPSLEPEVARILDAGADALYLIAFDEGARILAGLVDAGHGPQRLPIYGSDRLRSEALASFVDPDDPAVLDGMLGTAPVSDAVELPFARRLLDETGIDDPTGAAETYDCAIIIGLAAELSGTAFGPAMAQQLANVTSNGTECADFAECKALIEAGEDIAYQTASGVVLEQTPSGNHEPDSATYELWRINDQGQVETLSVTAVRF